MKTLTAIATAILSVAALGRDAHGQWNPSSGSSGMFGNRTVGSSLSAGQRTFGSNPPGSGATTSDLSGVGQIDSSDRFVRDNRQPGQFVGNSSQSLQDFVGAVQANQRMNQRAGQGNLAGPSQNRSANANRSGTAKAAQTPIRTTLQVAFPYRKPAPDSLSSQLVRRLASSPQIHTRSPVEVQVVGGTATLRGTVASEHDRALAARMVRLEVGVWKVDNQLTVAPVPGESPAPAGPAAVQPESPESGPSLEPAERGPLGPGN
jgi:osmotically-inducible protein OsmY